MTYDDAMTVREARDRYLSENGFSLAEYDARWVKLKLGPLPVAFPNFSARRRAVPLHDLHHVATGYGTDLRGEAEISAWELAAGCRDYWAARLLGVLGAAAGIGLAPRRTWSAWRRGRASRSLYESRAPEGLLGMTVGELRAHLKLAGTRAHEVRR